MCPVQPANRSRAQELEELAQLLLFKFNHLRVRVKKAADSYLTQLVDRYVEWIAGRGGEGRGGGREGCWLCGGCCV